MNTNQDGHSMESNSNDVYPFNSIDEETMTMEEYITMSTKEYNIEDEMVRNIQRHIQESSQEQEREF